MPTSSRTAAVVIDDLWKEYQIGGAKQSGATLYDTLANTLSKPWKILRETKAPASEVNPRIWALQGLSVKIQPGEVVGIIGRNGAGKSTLLKILSRITAPTVGTVTVRGRLASLLEVGTGFHPELTGRENIFLNAAVLGMSRKDVTRKFDEIVAFSEVDAFIDTPVKRYSSGMQVRLAFSVAAHLDVDVLLIDEVLAVGDSAFQEKCLGRMNAMSSAERAVIFVSHDIGAISRLCTRTVLLERGRLAFDGDVTQGLARYYARPMHEVVDLADTPFEGDLGNLLTFKTLRFRGAIPGSDAVFDPDRSFTFELQGFSHRDFDDLDIVISVFSRGTRMFTVHDAPPRTRMRAGGFVSSFELPGGVLRPGQYSVGVGAGRPGGREYSWSPSVAQFSIAESWNELRRHDSHGLISVRANSSRECIG